MKKIFEIALGVVTSIGGFLEIGSLATAAQAGAEFRYQLLWAIVLGGLAVIFLVEMSGRFAAVSHRTIPDAVRERFGFSFFVAPLVGFVLVTLLVLAAEIGGICIALELVTGVGFQWWALPVAFLVWLLMWIGTFGVIEKGASLLGLVTLCFVVGAVVSHPNWREVAAGAMPTLPQHDAAHYWFIAVSILGASISPYLFFFYSSGAIEDKWDESYLMTNRAVAGLGMSFGTLISIAVLVLAAVILLPRGIKVEHYNQLPQLLVPLFGSWGFYLFAASLGIACFGAAQEISLEMAYFIAQAFGWNWGKDERPRDTPRFSLVYTTTVFVAALPVLAGIDPLKLTVFSMALTAATLPLTTMPFIVLMNDEHYVGEHRNGWFSNLVVVLIIALAFVLAVVSIPLEIFGA